ncbi:pentapeptide repeat-containing protein (plasmid) [Acaryochloris sp. 'Moss Beach']|uniref:pentapeptide repeat-containing protein n=1 Tax=Acaryochloris sp. 'Moss Beach' TaxID=2740837 RepID=UPI001F178D21|nr:pentapeptide repeat-containing protein [Acaryochloris sp. 'Moss Beach']UJB72772.1 pentapeptide repeat-containing protein [Acaryochloris sp. 'Moss Beach']
MSKITTEPTAPPTACLSIILTLSEASQYLGVGIEVILQGLGQGGLRARREDGQWRFARSDLNNWFYLKFERDGVIPIHPELFNDLPLTQDYVLQKYEAGERYFADLTFSKLSFPRMRLVDIDFSGSWLGPVNFAGADLTGADFTGAFLQGANFQDANLNDVSFESADLSEANLRSANLKDAYLIGAMFDGANLMGVQVENTEIWRDVRVSRAN